MNTLTLQPARLTRIKNGIYDFLFAPASAAPLAVFRMGVAGVLLLQALAFAGSLQELYGSNAIVQWDAFEPAAMRTPFSGMLSIRWIAEALAPLGVSESAAVQGVFLVYVAALACLLIGWQTRIAAILAWLTHLAMNTSGSATIYGVDQFAHIALFYCTWMPVGGALSVDLHNSNGREGGASRPATGRLVGEPSWTARLALRVLQIHLCVVYVSSGIEKASGAQWWNGEAIWRALSLPELARFDFSWLAQVPWLAMLICWGTLAIEVGYGVLVWPKATRKWMALATLSLHVGIGVTMSLVSFSAFMCVLTASAFLVSAEPRRASPR